MKKLLPILSLLLTCGWAVTAQEVTFSEQIAPIIYENCTGCHRPGEVAPISFTNYEEVSSWGAMIQYVTEIKYMPPWPPNREFSHFIGERYLTDEEIQLIADWVDAGTPQGDPSLEPPLPTFSDGSQIGTPDVILEMEESYTIAGNNTDDYRVFVIPTNFTEDKEIASLEFRPGNSRAVHHVLFAYDVTGTAAALDAQSPNVYGYSSFGDFGINSATYLSWTYVPGALPLVYPEGIGQTIPAGADLLIQVHYAPLPTEEVDQSSINIFFKDPDDEIEREVRQAEVLPEDLPGGWFSFFIPANQTRTFTAIGADGDANGFNSDFSLISVLPHAHYLGTSYKIFAVTPQNDTLNVIEIKDWDFNWQGTYTLDRMLRIPAGSRLYTTASYDNTTNNPYNPSNPPVDVSWGEGTQDEMLVVFLYYVPYRDGDEDIVIGEAPVAVEEAVSSTGHRLLNPAPNPARDIVNLPFSLTSREKLSFELFTLDGRRINILSPTRDWSPGEHSLQLNAADYPPGTYLIKMSGDNFALSRKLVILK